MASGTIKTPNDESPNGRNGRRYSPIGKVDLYVVFARIEGQAGAGGIAASRFYSANVPTGKSARQIFTEGAIRAVRVLERRMRLPFLSQAAHSL
jgi:hypothetical protein